MSTMTEGDARARAWDERRERMREQADRGFPESWQPEEAGEELLGVVVDVKPAVPTAYGAKPIVVIQTPEGQEWSVWLFSTVLRREFERENVAIGEIVLIRYRGKVEREGPDPAYHDFRLVVDRERRSSQVDWRKIAQDQEDDVQELDRLRESSVPEYDDSQAAPMSPTDEDIPF